VLPVYVAVVVAETPCLFCWTHWPWRPWYQSSALAKLGATRNEPIRTNTVAKVRAFIFMIIVYWPSAVHATGALLQEERISVYCRQPALNPPIKVLRRTAR